MGSKFSSECLESQERSSIDNQAENKVKLNSKGEYLIGSLVTIEYVVELSEFTTGVIKHPPYKCLQHYGILCGSTRIYTVNGTNQVIQLLLDIKTQSSARLVKNKYRPEICDKLQEKIDQQSDNNAMESFVKKHSENCSCSMIRKQFEELDKDSSSTTK